jgi:hypothetical protein
MTSIEYSDGGHFILYVCLNIYQSELLVRKNFWYKILQQICVFNPSILQSFNLSKLRTSNYKLPPVLPFATIYQACAYKHTQRSGNR